MNKLKAFGYNLATVLLGLMFFMSCAATAGGWKDDEFLPGVFAKALAIAITVAFLIGTVWVRRRRARWMREEAIYESFAAFGAHVRENQNLMAIGRHLVGQLGGIGSGVLSAIRKAQRDATVEEAYAELQRMRDAGEIAEADYRSAVDELFTAVRNAF
jgi:hypothetical protein